MNPLNLTMRSLFNYKKIEFYKVIITNGHYDIQWVIFLSLNLRAHPQLSDRYKNYLILRLNNVVLSREVMNCFSEVPRARAINFHRGTSQSGTSASRLKVEKVMTYCRNFFLFFNYKKLNFYCKLKKHVRHFA